MNFSYAHYQASAKKQRTRWRGTSEAFFYECIRFFLPAGGILCILCLLIIIIKIIVVIDRHRQVLLE